MQVSDSENKFSNTTPAYGSRFVRTSSNQNAMYTT